MSHQDHHHDIDPMRQEIEEAARGRSGREFWRSLEELADTEKFRTFLHREFPALNAPEADPAMLDPTGRRNFMKLMSASLAMAGLTACTRQPKEYIVPYVKKPEGMVPGKPAYYATSMTLGGVAQGLLVRSNEGRPTKIEGHPDHPGTMGGTDVFAQASVLSLYDPDRSQSFTYLGDVRTWGDFVTAFRSALDGQKPRQGAGFRILTETSTSPTLAAQMQKVMAEFPQAKWHVYEPATRDGAREGARLAFGEPVHAVYQLDKASVLLSLDADFLTNGPGAVRYARDFVARRRLTGGAKEMNRLYVVESTLSTTGAKADHRLPLKASDVLSFARAVAAGCGVDAGAPGPLSAEAKKMAEAVARDLKANPGQGLVLAGEHQPAAVHAIANAINAAVGAIGSTVILTDPIEVQPVDQAQSLAELVRDMNAERVDLLLILGGNPVYNAPVFKDEKSGKALTFLDAMQKVGLRVHLGLYVDETAEHCQWHVAEAHYLESWSDARTHDGTACIIQPLIEPLYRGKSAHELLAVVGNEPGIPPYDLVRNYWKGQLGESFEQTWRQAVHDGFVANTARAPKAVALRSDWAATLPSSPAKSGQEIVFRLDPSVYDGRFANNSWLQELPKPISKVTWDNYAIVSARTAASIGLSPNDEPYHANAKMVRLVHEGRELSMPAWVQPGHPDDSVTVYLGYGRTRAGSVGTRLGFNTYTLRSASAPFIATTGVRFEVGEGSYQLASTQEHFAISTSDIKSDFMIPGEDLEARHIVRTASLADYQHDPHEALHHGAHKPGKELTVFTPWKYEGYAWGMAIDMNACVGCNACVVACQSENNIAVVGKDLVTKGRIMHWLRIDTYFKGGAVNPEVFFQPMMCQHCENAPCEVVCPVNATVHDAEGLNVQVYNRCVGTRYCSNNCPYKVRRFNYLLYGDWDTPSLKNVRNPEVTIRSRGVMEKCTFCSQRIMAGKIEAEKQNRKVKDGEIQTACQTACPTEAIIFGDLNDPESRVAKLKLEPRNYDVLADLNTRPRASYLAAIRNTNAELGNGHGNSHDGHAGGAKNHG
jgi:molybdopterin-containing oxidoreductase family iron-sulfur binding subunit